MKYLSNVVVSLKDSALIKHWECWNWIYKVERFSSSAGLWRWKGLFILDLITFASIFCKALYLTVMLPQPSIKPLVPARNKPLLQQCPVQNNILVRKHFYFSLIQYILTIVSPYTTPTISDPLHHWFPSEKNKPLSNTNWTHYFLMQNAR